MPIPGEYTWKETSTHVHVRLALRGATGKTVDVYCADLYAKISYPPRLVELDLLHEVDADGARARIKDGYLTLSVPKAAPGPTWGALVLDRKQFSKAVLVARREDARDRRAAREREIAEKAKDRKGEDERLALRKQMTLDETERSTVEDKKSTEKEAAEASMYATLRETAAREAALKEDAEAERRAADAERRRAEVVAEVTAGGFDLDNAPSSLPPPPPPEKKTKKKKAKTPEVRDAGTKVVGVTHMLPHFLHRSYFIELATPGSGRRPASRGGLLRPLSPHPACCDTVHHCQTSCTWTGPSVLCCVTSCTVAPSDCVRC